MAQSRSNTVLAFIVGALVVVVAVLGYFVLGGPAEEEDPGFSLSIGAGENGVTVEGDVEGGN